MTVLLVDDQISILSGLISGLDWDALDVTAIRTANNAIMAKEILNKEQIDVLLCDIEMPGENGLSLLRWARKQGMNFVCVFLTSHADFMYAKEAIKLNCFDYILQPARYEDIQNTIAKAINRATQSHMANELKQFGIIAKIHAPGLFQNLFSDWIAEKKLSVSALCDMLRRMGQNVPPTNDCFIIWGHLLRWHSEPWSNNEWVYTVNNIITEVYETNHYGILSFSIDYTSIGWFVYALSNTFCNPDSITEPLNKAYSVISEHMPCDFAFYLSPIGPINQLNAQANGLNNAKRNNVLQKSGIFNLHSFNTNSSIDRLLDNTQIRRWEVLLTQEDGRTVCEEIFRFIDDATEKKQVDYKFLHTFWIQFQQIVLNALWDLKRDRQELLPMLEQGEKAQSLSEIRDTIQEIVKFFQSEDNFSCNPKNLVEQIKRYIEDNIDQPLTVANVSASFFMNNDYLSRLFKKECGITLKEYIVNRKMEIAQSLLLTTALPVSVIASKLGYDNFSYFSQIYRRVMGISPTDLRK